MRELKRGEYYILEISAYPLLESGGRTDEEELEILKEFKKRLQDNYPSHTIRVEGFKIKNQQTGQTKSINY